MNDPYSVLGVSKNATDFSDNVVIDIFFDTSLILSISLYTFFSRMFELRYIL